jgi:hypothetical protein
MPHEGLALWNTEGRNPSEVLQGNVAMEMELGLSLSGLSQLVHPVGVLLHIITTL